MKKSEAKADKFYQQKQMAKGEEAVVRHIRSMTAVILWFWHGKSRQRR